MGDLRLQPRPRSGVVLGVLWALVVAPGGAGCSFVLVDKPPPRAARTPGFTCTQSPRWPATDIGLALAGLGESVYAVSKGSTAWPGLVAAAIFSASAATGVYKVNACNRALGHPYVPRAPTAQPDMMPEMPFGLAHAPEGPLEPGDSPYARPAAAAPQHPPAGLMPEKPSRDQPQ